MIEAQACVSRGAGTPLVWENVQLSKPQDNELLVAGRFTSSQSGLLSESPEYLHLVKACGICHAGTFAYPCYIWCSIQPEFDLGRSQSRIWPICYEACE